VCRVYVVCVLYAYVLVSGGALRRLLLLLLLGVPALHLCYQTAAFRDYTSHMCTIHKQKTEQKQNKTKNGRITVL
jgi:hypothetical protein